MTSVRSLSNTRPSPEPASPCPDYASYFNLVGKVIFGHPPATVSGRPGCPEKESYVEWLLSRSHCLLPYRDVPVENHDPLRSPSATARDATPALSPTSATGSAINRELLLEAVLVRKLELCVREARDEQFVDGMDSEFASRIHDSIMKHGSVAVWAWERVMLKTGNANETGEELLRQLGLLYDPATHGSRLRVLVDSLALSDPRMRDAAGLGLSFLDDVSALPKLRAAFDVEKNTWLRRNLNLVIDQLEASGCHDS